MAESEARNYQIFISYRRDGGESLAMLLRDRLREKGYRVFLDVESLRSGDFNEALYGVIEQCTDVLLVLPPNGLDRCIGNPDDWVRREIEHAFECEKNMIPVLMRNFQFPDEKDLPLKMKPLLKMNGVPASMDYFDAVIDKIVNQRLQSRVQDNADEEKRHFEKLEKEARDPECENRAAAFNELGTIYEQGSLVIVQNMKKAYACYREGREAGSLAAEYNLGRIYESAAADLTLVREYGINTQNLAAEQSVSTTGEVRTERSIRDRESGLDGAEIGESTAGRNGSAAANTDSGYYSGEAEGSEPGALAVAGVGESGSRSVAACSTFQPGDPVSRFRRAGKKEGTAGSVMGSDKSSKAEADADIARSLLLAAAWGCYESGAAKEYAPALYRLSNLLEEQLRLKEAFECCSRAAEQDYLPAVNALGWMYKSGIGTEQNLLLAEQYYRRGKDAGYAPSIYNYAYMIEDRDPRTAMNLYSRVAYGEKEIPLAAYALGRCYENRMADRRNAIVCYENALAGGIAAAADALERCRGMLG